MLQVIVIGANGGIGRHCVEQALAAGHLVTAIVRNPAKISIEHRNLIVVQGDVLDPGSIQPHFSGKDAVISTIGVNTGLTSDRATTLYSAGALNIIQIMQASGVRRAFFISAAAVETNPLLPFLIRFVSKHIIQKLLKHMYADLRHMENEIRTTDLDWTIVRPPQLTNKAVTGQYRIAVNGFLKNGLKISRADTAHFMLAHVLDTATYQSVVEIAY